MVMRRPPGPDSHFGLAPSAAGVPRGHQGKERTHLCDRRHGQRQDTTLAAMLNGINQTSDVHIITLEDPIEFCIRISRPRSASASWDAIFYLLSGRLRAACGRRPSRPRRRIRDRGTMEYCGITPGNRHAFSAPCTPSARDRRSSASWHVHADEEQQVRRAPWWDPALVISQPAWFPERTVGGCWSPVSMAATCVTPIAIGWGEDRKPRLSDIIERACLWLAHVFGLTGQGLRIRYDHRGTSIHYCISNPKCASR